METVITEFDGCPLLVPMMKLYDGRSVPLRFPYDTFEEFASFCGAGAGIGDLIVPETIFGIKVSPVCFIHDIMWQMAESTWADFHYSNSIMFHNLITVVHVKSANRFMEHIRNYRVVTFYNAVDTIGEPVFWSLKKKQQLSSSGIRYHYA